MKAIIMETPPDFKSIQLIITVETLEELIQLYARFNVGVDKIKDSYPPDFKDQASLSHKAVMPFTVVAKEIQKYRKSKKSC